MAKKLIREMNTRTIPIVDFGCRHGKLSYLYDDIFDAYYYNEEDFNPEEYEEYDEIIDLIREKYDGHSAFYEQVLGLADEYINEAFHDLEIPAHVRAGSCKWDIPRSGWYDTAIEFDLDIDLDWVEDTFMELYKNPDFINYVKGTFSSYDGFISFIPNDVSELQELLDPSDADYWKVVVVLIRYIISCDDYTVNSVSESLEDYVQGNPDFITCSTLGIY